MLPRALVLALCCAGVAGRFPPKLPRGGGGQRAEPGAAPRFREIHIASAAVGILALRKAPALRRARRVAPPSSPAPPPPAPPPPAPPPPSAVASSPQAAPVRRRRRPVRRLVRTLFALPGRVVQILPATLPAWWRPPRIRGRRLQLTAFLASNAAYLCAGVGVLLRPRMRQAPLGALLMAACAYSTAYHIVQIVKGHDHPATARMCALDTALAVVTGVVFAQSCGVTRGSVAIGALSIAFFFDVFRCGYLLSHSLWHLSSAALAFAAASKVPPPRVVRQIPRRANYAAAEVEES